MDMTYNLPVQPATKLAPVAKTPVKSAQSGADGQGKSFEDVLKQSAENAAEELPVEKQPAVDEDAADETGQKAVVASVLIGLLPEVQLEAESAPGDAVKAQAPQEASSAKSAFSAAIAQLVEQKKADIQKQMEEIKETGVTNAQKFAQMAATTKPLEGEKDAAAHLDVLDLRQTAQSAQQVQSAQQAQTAANQRNLAELLPTGEADEAQKAQGLLQLLNAKGASNAALLTEAQAQAAQNQAQPAAKAPVLAAEQPKLELPVTQEAPAVNPQQTPLEKPETAALTQSAAANPAEKSVAPIAQPIVTEETPENAAVNPALKHSAAKSFDSESAPQGEQQSAGDSKASQTAALTQTAGSAAKSEPAPSFGQVFSGVSAQQPLTQQSAPVELAEPKAAQQLVKYDVPGQIVEQARLIRTDEDTQMVIRLKPEHLGELTLRVRVENGVVNASFHSENAQVRSLLEASLFQLKQDLASQGIKVDNVGVYAGMGQQQPDQGQAGRDQQAGRSRSRRIRMADVEDEAEALKSVNQAAAEDGVDYLI